MRKFLNRRRQQGFTLIELLIVIAIIGIIAALLIPNFLDALNKAKQKRSMGDIRDMGTAWMTWLTDQFGAAAAAGATTQQVTLPATANYSSVVGNLQPRYIQEVRQQDGWGNSYVFCSQGTPQQILQAPNNNQAGLAISSPGNDGVMTRGACQATVDTGPFDPTDYAQDLIWADGFFIRYPQKTS